MATIPEALKIGIGEHQAGRLQAAEQIYRQILAVEPKVAEAWQLLGIINVQLGRQEVGVECMRRAVALQPNWPEPHNNLGNLLREQGNFDEAIACYRRALELKPDYVESHSNLLQTLHYRSGVTRSELALAHAEYERRYAAPLRATWKPHANDRDSGRRLRLGFVSPDLGRHPVGYFLIGAFEKLDPGQCETFCYCDRQANDDFTARFRAAATSWQATTDWNNERLAEQIRADGIDILFDLAGHTARNRLLVFARKPAPIQIVWIGYEGTTGLAAMDYILVDRHLVPPGAEADYCEKVLRMPDGYMCYEPPSDAPPVSLLPALKSGHVTFGCFNNPMKYTSQVVETWGRILNEVPSARLLLKYRGMDDPSVVRRFSELLAARGVDPGRLDFLGRSSFREYLGCYDRIDLALDPFPFAGGVTTCEALWMGVPVITCPGATLASRHALSYLSNIGLTETIAADLDGYVKLAVALAGDVSHLAALRAGLRDKMAASPLCDGARFATNLMSVLRAVWREWCESGVRAE